MEIKEVPISDIKPYHRNPRKNDSAVDAVAKSIQEFGFRQPIVVDKDGIIIVGHTRYKAAKKLGLKTVPVHYADLDEQKAKAYRLADNKSGELSDWDIDLLGMELDDVTDIDMEQFGFESESGESSEHGERKEIDFVETISVVIDCENDEQAEKIFLRLQKEGYKCRISTL